MPRTADDWDDDENDDWDEDTSDWEPEEEDDSDAVTVPCPHCREPVYEDAEYCPSCEQYITREDAPAERKPLWLILGVAVCLAVVFMWIW